MPQVGSKNLSVNIANDDMISCDNVISFLKGISQDKQDKLSHFSAVLVQHRTKKTVSIFSINFAVPRKMLYWAQVCFRDIFSALQSSMKKLYRVFTAVEVREGLMQTTHRCISTKSSIFKCLAGF